MTSRLMARSKQRTRTTRTPNDGWITTTKGGRLCGCCYGAGDLRERSLAVCVDGVWWRGVGAAVHSTRRLEASPPAIPRSNHVLGFLDPSRSNPPSPFHSHTHTIDRPARFSLPCSLASSLHATQPLMVRPNFFPAAGLVRSSLLLLVGLLVVLQPHQTVALGASAASLHDAASGGGSGRRGLGGMAWIPGFKPIGKVGVVVGWVGGSLFSPVSPPPSLPRLIISCPGNPLSQLICVLSPS